MDTALRDNSLSVDDAQRLAGKLTFLTTTLFGQLGKAALTPIFARATGTEQSPLADVLNGPLRSALRALIGMLHEIQPRFIPRFHQQDVIVIYTDAYFLPGEDHQHAPSHSLPLNWSKSKCPHWETGWGYVVHFRGQTHYGYGRAPGLLPIQAKKKSACQWESHAPAEL